MKVFIDTWGWLTLRDRDESRHEDVKAFTANFVIRMESFLSDPMAATGIDPDHSIDEFRYITFGVSNSGRLLVVAHTERGETIRIISARSAIKGERKIYEEG